MNNSAMFAIVPPTPWELAEAAYQAVRARKKGKPLPWEMWSTAHHLWWDWWGEAVAAERGWEYLTPLRGVQGVQAQVACLKRLAEKGGRP